MSRCRTWKFSHNTCWLHHVSSRLRWPQLRHKLWVTVHDSWTGILNHVNPVAYEGDFFVGRTLVNGGDTIKIAQKYSSQSVMNCGLLWVTSPILTAATVRGICIEADWRLNTCWYRSGRIVLAMSMKWFAARHLREDSHVLFVWPRYLLFAALASCHSRTNTLWSRGYLNEISPTHALSHTSES
jgi:hypothetical protein